MANPVNLESAKREVLKTELRDNLDASSVNRVLTDADVTLEEVQTLTPDEKAKFRAALTAQKAAIGETTHTALEALLAATEGARVTPPAAPASAPEATRREVVRESTREVADAAGYARAGISKAFKNPGEAGYTEYLSTIRRVMGKIPGYEPSSQSDIADAIYQSRDFNMGFVSWLVAEAGKNTNSFDTSGKGAGMWPFVGEKTSFESVEEKQKVIVAMLKGLGDELQKPEIQAGWIESFLGDGVGKKLILIGGGTLAVAVVGGVLLWTGTKWALKRALGAAGVAIAGAIGSMTGKGVALGAQAVRSGVSAVRNRGAGAPTPAAAPGAAPAVTPSATPTRELDVTKPIEKAGFDGILRELYNQEVSQGTRPGPALGNADAIPKDFIDEVKAEVDPARSAEYQNRVARFIQTLEQKPAPTGNTAKDKVALDTWQRNLDLAIRGEKDPSRWGKLRGAPVPTASAGDLRSRVSQAGLDLKFEVFEVGGNRYNVISAAKAPLEEIRSLEEQIKAKEGELPALREAKKALEARLRDEKKYAEATHALKGIDADIATKQGELSTAQKEVSRIRGSHMTVVNHTGGPNTLNQVTLDADPTFDAAEEKVRKLSGELQGLKDKKISAGATKSSLEGKYNNINRGLTVDATGTLTNSVTMQKLESTTAPNLGVKEQIRKIEVDVESLHKRIGACMRILNRISSNIPATWNKAGIDITMPDGARIRVSQLGVLLENLSRALVKR